MCRKGLLFSILIISLVVRCSASTPSVVSFEESLVLSETVGEYFNRPFKERRVETILLDSGDFSIDSGLFEEILEGDTRQIDTVDSTDNFDIDESLSSDEQTAETDAGCYRSVVGGRGKIISITLGIAKRTLVWNGCRKLLFQSVAPAGMKVRVEVGGLSPLGSFRLGLFGPKTFYLGVKRPLWAEGFSGSKGYISVEFRVIQSGEFFAELSKLSGPSSPLNIEVRAYCSANCHLETTRYPVVLLHGFAGTDKYFGRLDYFYNVRGYLQKRGYLVFTPVVQPIADSKVRVNRLADRIDEILRRTGAAKLNLIAHSQGGIDGRLLISRLGYGSRVATLTTISSPHRGIPLPQLLIPPAGELSEKNMKRYNKIYPNDPVVKYFSWAGVTCSRLDFKCRKKYKNEVVDPLLSSTFLALKALRGANDGVVPVSSAKWGIFLGELPADHWDEIGQIADKNNRPFRHLDFYLSEVRRLKRLGF